MSKYSLPKHEQLPEIDLYMDQVITLLTRYIPDGNVTASMLNNYVKLQLVASADKKKYNRDQLGDFFIICTLKRVLTIAQIKSLLLGLSENSNYYDLFVSLINDPDTPLPLNTTYEQALFHAVNAVISASKADEYLGVFKIEESLRCEYYSDTDDYSDDYYDSDDNISRSIFSKRFK